MKTEPTFFKNFFSKNKVAIILLAIIALGAYLRLYEFGDLVRFNDDQARDAQIVDNITEKKEFPLLGPKAGGTKFNLGPAFYYLEYLSALIFGNDPAGIATVTVILSIASIPLFYFFLRFYFSEKISLFATLLYSISFFAIKYSKFSWNPNVIPFFFLVFFISFFKILSSEKSPVKKWFRYSLLGLSLGIGTQLHALLLILLPLLVILEIVRLLWTGDRKKCLGLFAALVIGATLNLPLIVHDIRNNWENTRLFFQATEKKAGENFSAGKNMLKNVQFFINGNAYVLAGYEPQKDWLESKKYFSPNNFKEIALSSISAIFMIVSLFAATILYRKESNLQRKIFLRLILSAFLLSFLIFWPLANDLKSRFFIVCFAYPFIFLSFLITIISPFLSAKKWLWIIFSAFAALLIFSNFRTFAKAYDFSRHSDKSDIYGGISLKETKVISSFITASAASEELQNRKFHLFPFKFNKSIKYLNRKSGLHTPMESFSSAKKIAPGSVLIWLGKSKNAEKIPRNKNFSDFHLVKKIINGRFAVFLFEKK